MNRLSLALAVVLASALQCPSASAQVSATGTGGAGGSGGSAAGGTATGGTASGGTATNTTTGTSSAAGNTANIGAATSNYQGADVTVNYVTPAGAAGLKGLAAGVDPNTGHIVSDNNVNYSGTQKIKNTPDVNLGGAASGACNGLSGGVGVGIPGLAVGANVSTVDKGCEARETARVAAMLGRMDVANAVLENMEVVIAAIKARDARAALDAAEGLASAKRNELAAQALANAAQAAEAARRQEAEAMRAQQQAGVDALTRQATMAKVNDTLKFTGRLTQEDEKTAQQLMVEQLAAQAAPAPVAVPVPQPTLPVEGPEVRPVVAPPAGLPAARADAEPAASTGESRRTSGAIAADRQAAKPVRPEAVARREPERAVQKPKPVDPPDAIRFALGLSDDAPTALR